MKNFLFTPAELHAAQSAVERDLGFSIPSLPPYPKLARTCSRIIRFFTKRNNKNGYISLSAFLLIAYTSSCYASVSLFSAPPQLAPLVGFLIFGFTIFLPGIALSLFILCLDGYLNHSPHSPT